MRLLATCTLLAGIAACGDAPSVTEAPTANGAVAPPPITAPAAPKRAKVERASVFTLLDPQTCRLVEENREEGSYWRRACPGTGGYAVEWSESDLRQGLEVIDGKGRKTSLDLSRIAANGAFNQLGQRIEWRGEAGRSPDALIVRVFVADASRPDAPERSLLAVAKLAPRPCLVALIRPGPAQNERARDAADSPGACLGG